MDIVHCADLHIGVTTHGIKRYDGTTAINDRIEDFLIAIDWIIDYVEDNDIDLVVIPGDIFHTANPTPYTLSEFALRLNEFSSVCPVVVIPGNHDQVSSRVSAVNVFGSVSIHNVHMWEEPTCEIITTKSGDVVVAGMPYPTHRILGDGNITELTHNALLELANHDFDEALPSILLGHFTIEGCTFGAYRPPVLKQDATAYIDSMDGLWDYVALGHIHQQQTIPSKHTPIVYSGSIERIDFGEANEAKGFIHITIDEDDIDYKFVEIPARPMATIDITLDAETEQSDIINQLNNTIIHPDSLTRLRVVVDGNTEYINTIVVASDLLKKRVYRLIQPQLSRIKNDVEEYVGDSLAGLEPIALLEEYLILHIDSDDEIDDLLDLFETVLEEVDYV